VAQLHELMPDMGRMLMVDFIATQARAEGAAPTINHEGSQRSTLARASQTMATAATPLNLLPLGSANGVDRLYHQLEKIDAIATA
jgi:hypothetical protein